MAASYTIDAQRTVTRSAPGGTFVRVVEVTFTAHPSGQTGVVDVPYDGYGPDTVDAAVTPAAQALNAVQAL